MIGMNGDILFLISSEKINSLDSEIRMTRDCKYFSHLDSESIICDRDCCPVSTILSTFLSESPCKMPVIVRIWSTTLQMQRTSSLDDRQRTYQGRLLFLFDWALVSRSLSSSQSVCFSQRTPELIRPEHQIVCVPMSNCNRQPLPVSKCLVRAKSTSKCNLFLACESSFLYNAIKWTETKVASLLLG